MVSADKTQSNGHCQMVRAVRLWNDTILNLNAVVGFGKPRISAKDSYAGCWHASIFTMEFEVYTEHLPIVVCEKLPTAVPLVLDESNSYVKAQSVNLNSLSYIAHGWELSDGSFSSTPSENLKCFIDFTSKYKELVSLWNKGLPVTSYKEDENIPNG